MTKFIVSSVDGAMGWPLSQTMIRSSTLAVFAPEKASVEAERITATQAIGGSQ